MHPALTFSQHSLSDFQDCPRRFYLRYVAQQAWPAPDETSGGLGQDELDYLRQGRTLHRWIERHWLNISPSNAQWERAPSTLRQWWERFRQTSFDHLPPIRQPEVELVADLGGYRLYARFDLLAYDEALESVVIVDWKTMGFPQPPSYDFWCKRMQTRVYLYVLVTAGAALFAGRAPAPERCSIWYWLANHPEAPWVRVPYTQAAYELDRRQLGELVAEIARRKDEQDFEQTLDQRQCARCVYRLLCQRTSSSTTDWLLDDDLPLPDDIASVQELEY
ncbi:MAG: PD-(D/E)XK nuclease family protein [Thermoflexales bacterium]